MALLGEYTSPVPVDHPRVMFWVYSWIFMIVWLGATVYLALTIEYSGFFLGVINYIVATPLSKWFHEKRERIKE